MISDAVARSLWRICPLIAGLWACGALGAGPTPPQGSADVRARAVNTALAPCPAQSPWRLTLERDIEAIATWVEEVYPAVVDPLNPGFNARWQQALLRARARAGVVCDYAGWRATLRELTHSARDGHVVLVSAQPAWPVRWTGFAVELQGGRFLLRRVSAALDASAPPDAAQLIACDAQPIAERASAALDRFAGDWTVESRRPSLAVALLVDDGNPFVAPPSTCTVEAGGERREWALPWTVAPASQVLSAIAPYSRIAPNQRARLDYALADDGAAWITVGNLFDEQGHGKLLDSVAGDVANIRKAPYIVWDLRGNGGGNSALGDALAEAVWGQGTLKAQREPRHPKRWRASARVVPLVEAVPTPFADMLMPPLQEALRKGEPLFTDPWESKQSAEPDTPQPAAKTGPVFVLTDAGCFSSCILLRNLLVRMGAVQVGDPTGRDEVYGESWFKEALPSQLGELMLPIAIFGDHADERGGTPPDLPWTGSARDEAGIRRLIADAARGARAGRAAGARR